jgi:hypothetical protein
MTPKCIETKQVQKGASLMTKDIQFEQFLQALPDNYEQLAVKNKAFARSRVLSDANELMALIMSYAGGSDLSLRSCAGVIASAKGKMSDMGVKKD